MRKLRSDIKLADILLDRGSEWPDWGPRRVMLLSAKRFVFDASAAAFFGELVKKAARMILREQEFARQPYPQTWIEVDARAYALATDETIFRPEDADDKFGFLYVNGVVYGAAYSSKYALGNWSPFRIHLHQPMTFEQEMEAASLCDYSRLTYRLALIGHSEPFPSEWWSSGEVDAIVRSHRYEPLGNLPAAANHNLLNAHTGVLKQVLALLLLLTRPGQRVLTITDEGHKRTIWRGHNMLLVNHHVVKLHLAQKTAIRRFLTGIHTGLHRRHHDVRGHWAQTRRLQASCTHVWDPVDEDHYRCLRCEAKRWWRKDHQRGRLELGSISKSYDVTE